MAKFPRLLLGLASLLSLAGAVLHGSAFGKLTTVVAGSNLPLFFGGALKAFWLNDSATMLILAALFGALAAWPAMASRGIVILLSLFPIAGAAVLYAFLGAFLAVPFSLGIGLLALIAGLFWPRTA